MPAETGTVRRCAVIGSPVEHSLSPALHTAAYRALGLPWEYDLFDVTADELPTFLAGLGPEWRGFSVTMPLKRPVLAECDEVDSSSDLVRSVNTVVLDDNGRRLGYNTDVTGLVAALQQAEIRSVNSMVVVGAGATAASALVAGAQLGCASATVLARDPGRSAVLRGVGERVGVTVTVRSLESNDWPTADLLVSTIPAAAQPRIASPLVERVDTVLDVIYSPWQTPLLQAADAARRRAVYGFEMLLHQAGRQVELMTGAVAAPLPAMRSAGLAAAGRDG
jgi:shikimate-5-dehydrogenase